MLPETAITSRALSLHCLETKPGNLICLYHAEKDKNGKIFDGATDGKYKVTGTPYPRNVRGPDDAEVPMRMKKHLHCGCPEDEVLMAFIWWKTLVTDSASSGAQEGFRDQQLDPRTRTFMYQMWCDTTFQTVNAMFKGGRSIDEFRIRNLEKRIAAIQEALDDEKKEQAARKVALKA